MPNKSTTSRRRRCTMSLRLVKLVISALICASCTVKLVGADRRDESRSFGKPLREIYQPVDVGFQFATPLNLANTLQNSVAGPVSIGLIVGFAGILVAGLVSSKFSQQDVFTSRSDDENIFGFIARIARLLENLDADAAFRFMGDQRDACKRKVICQLHQSLIKAPDWVQLIVRFISRNIRGVSKYREDILEGLAGSDCNAKYRTQCPLSIGDIFIRTPLMRHIFKQQNRHFQTANDHTFQFV